MRLDIKLRGVIGGTSAKRLEGLGLVTVEDLLRYYPRRLLSTGELTPLGELRIGEHATIQVEISDVGKTRWLGSKRSLTKLLVTDGSSDMELTFFNQHWLADKLRAGQTAMFSGKVEAGYGRRRVAMTNPASLYSSARTTDADVAAMLRPYQPIYPGGAKVQSWQLTKALDLVFADPAAIAELDDPIPDDVRASFGLPRIGRAFEMIHRPESSEQFYAGMHRFRFEEGLVVQVALAQRRAAYADLPAPALRLRDAGVLASFDATLPFELTAGQQSVSDEIFTDIAAEHPMHRLLQGEVGSGKTVVALRAMLACVDSGRQAALLAPTEVLAQQHYRSLRALLGPLGARGTLEAADTATSIGLLTGSTPAAARRGVLADLASGELGIVVGTHALLSQGVDFAGLGLVVVDEQHRFGVEQRAALTEKADAHPHVLVMTATPIPRTVAMTVFGDLTTSVLSELPRGRQPISTTVVPRSNRAWVDRTWARVGEEVAKGHQVYVVCPKIGGDDTGTAAEEEGLVPVEDTEPPAEWSGVHETYEMLSAGPLSGLRLAELHGRMAPDDKDETMRGFAAGRIDVLVATTVIEVGVDVPNATMMVILDAERFGVSQLHQLRGRVGRGGHPGLCLLVTGIDDPEHPSVQRLSAVAASTDGFELSEFDLEQRREGDVLGSLQSGRRSSLRLLGVLRDRKLIEQAREAAERIVSADPDLESAPRLAAAVRELAERADYLEKS